MKKIIKVIIFLILLNMIFLTIAYTLLPKENGYNSIDYFKNNNQLDVIWLGPSTTYFAISPMYIWNKFGITSYNNAHNDQRLTTYFLLNDIKKYNPKVIFFDITTITDNSFPIENNWGKQIYQWHLSFITRYKYIQYTKGNYKDILYYFIMNQFHSRWKELTEKDFINNRLTYYLLGSNPNFIRQAQEVNLVNTGEYSFSEESINIINKIAQFVKDNKLNVIFWCPPTTTQHRYERSFLFEQLIAPYNITYINFNKLWKEIALDYKNDFFDINHVNVYGGEKVSDYLIKYAMEKYTISSHHNSSKYDEWNKNYTIYKRQRNEMEIRTMQEFSQWKKFATFDNYTIMLSINGYILNKIPDTLKKNLEDLGLSKINTSNPYMNYIAIIDNNTVFHEEISNIAVSYKGKINGITNIFIKSDGQSTINISGKEVSKNKEGLNFVVYDKVNREVVDSIWINEKNDYAINR